VHVGVPRFDSLSGYAQKKSLRSARAQPEWVRNIPVNTTKCLVATSAIMYDIQQLIALLEYAIDSSLFLIFKPHPNMPIEALLRGHTLFQSSNCWAISNENINELLLWADILITTHSTVAEEAIAIGVPAISVHAGAHINTAALACLPVQCSVNSSDELRRKIKELSTMDIRAFEQMRAYVIQQCFGNIDGTSTARVAEIIEGFMNNEANGLCGRLMSDPATGTLLRTGL
jgi:hypothetical protein